jgi:hypothetical protein
MTEPKDVICRVPFALDPIFRDFANKRLDLLSISFVLFKRPSELPHLLPSLPIPCISPESRVIVFQTRLSLVLV